MSGRRSIPVAAPVLGTREIECVTDAVRSGWVSSLGGYLDRFEQEFAAFAGARHGVAVCNGTTALHLALRALRIGPGDEVVVPDLTFAATAHAVVEAGAVPVFADVDPETWCIDPRALERAIGPRTRAVMAVHLYGHPADMDATLALCEPRGIIVIEDAAEAHGARVGSRRVGSIGKLGVFSFYGNKLITTGEGGMLTTDDEALAGRARFLKGHAMTRERRYFHDELGFNYSMTNIQAALGVAQLERIEEFIARKRAIFTRYAARLSSLGLVSNAERAGYVAVFWMVCAVLTSGDAARRDALCARLREHGIETRPFFAPMSHLPHLAAYRSVCADGEGCPVAARLAERGFNLPSGCGLTDDDIDYVCDALAAVL